MLAAALPIPLQWHTIDASPRGHRLKPMTHTLITDRDNWSFQAVGVTVYVTQTRRDYVSPSGRHITNQVMTHSEYTTKQARDLWLLLLKAGAKPA